MTMPTEVSAKPKIGAGTETQFNFGDSETPDWKVIPGLQSSSDWGYDQEAADSTPIADDEHSYTAGDKVAKAIVLTMNHMPGDADQKTVIDAANANEEVQIRKVYPTGFTQTATFLLTKPYYSDPTRSETIKVALSATPQGGIVDGTIV